MSPSPALRRNPEGVTLGKHHYSIVDWLLFHFLAKSLAVCRLLGPEAGRFRLIYLPFLIRQIYHSFQLQMNLLSHCKPTPQENKSLPPFDIRLGSCALLTKALQSTTVGCADNFFCRTTRPELLDLVSSVCCRIATALFSLSFLFWYSQTCVDKVGMFEWNAVFVQPLEERNQIKTNVQDSLPFMHSCACRFCCQIRCQFKKVSLYFVRSPWRRKKQVCHAFSVLCPWILSENIENVPRSLLW